MNTASLNGLLADWQGIVARMKRFSPLILWGDGHVAQILPFLRQQGVHPEHVLCQEEKGGGICGLEAIGPQALRSMPASMGVCVCCLGGIEIAHALKPFTDCPVLDAFLPLGHEMFTPHFAPRTIAANIDRIQSARELFTDPASRELYDALLAFRLTCDLRLLPLPEYPLYYHPAAAPRAGDIIIDAGAYDGDTALSFAHATDNRARIYAFEPGRENMLALRRNVKKANLANHVEAVPMALWSEDGHLSFSGCKTDACVDADGGERVRATTIDSFCSARRASPTLIKMDLEGAEREALHGAAATIASHRPRLALSVYHRPEDLWEIPLLANRLRPESTFSLARHEGPEALAETVCYVT